RRSGVATALLAAVQALAAEGGADRLLLEVREDNAAARGFYERHGFTELGKRARYYRDGTTALVLAAPVTMVP
ncbi:GNAT family N-acetyltransferase, partial [Nocardioides sp. GCM10030258]